MGSNFLKNLGPFQMKICTKKLSKLEPIFYFIDHNAQPHTEDFHLNEFSRTLLKLEEEEGKILLLPEAH